MTDTQEQDTAADVPATPPTSVSYWERLHHHKVVHWLLAYAATAYTLLHGIEMLSDAQGWPHIIVRVVSWLLVLGTPIVATIAWYHGAKGLHRVSGPELLIISFLGLIAGTLLWAFTGQHEINDGDTHTVATPAILDKSIAVLPFSNLSASADDEYLADGLADTLLRMLSENRQLKVIARTSSFSFKGKSDDVRSIGAKLGVTTLLEGSVQRSGDRLRVIAQLVSTKDGTHLWSKTYDRMMTDVFAVQDEIAAQVVASLSVSLTTSSESPNNAKPKHVPPVEAYQEYLQGIQLLGDSGQRDANAAAEHFQKAVDIDPAYALAFVGIAQSVLINVRDAVIMPPDIWRRANSAVQRALVLEPDLAEAWTQLGVARNRQGDVLGANQAFRRAIEVNPGYARAYADFGSLPGNGLIEEETRELLERAAALDPLQAPIQAARASVAWGLGNFDDAVTYARRALELNPRQVSAYNVIGQVHSSRGQLDDAIRYRRKALALQPGSPNLLIALEHLYLYLGDEASSAEARSQLAAAAPNSIQNIYRLAEQAWLRGDTEMAVREINHAYQMVPGFRNAGRLLARIDFDAGRFDAAIRRIRSGYPELNTMPISINVINGFAALLLSQSLLAAGRADEAKPVLEAAERFFRSTRRPTSLQFVEPGVTLTLARTLALQGRRDEALKELRAALERGDGYDWQYWSVDPMFSSIADAPEFKQCMEIVKARNAKQQESLRRNPDLAVS